MSADQLSILRTTIAADVRLFPLSALRQRDWAVRQRARVYKNRPAARRLPVSFMGAVPLTASYETVNHIPALRQRFCARVPLPDKRLMKRMMRPFVWSVCRKHLTPFARDRVFDYQTWEDRSNYRGAEKVKMRKVRDRLRLVDGVIPDPLPKSKSRVGIFQKAQWMEEKKHMRWIMPRSDAYKVTFGPLVSAMEKEVYENLKAPDHPYFIKHVPVDERPALLEKTFHGKANIVATDHSRFEAHFCELVQNTIEFTVYEYLCQYNPYAREMCKRLKHIQAGRQHVLGYGFAAEMGARRMSGDLTTSLGNGLTNLFVMLLTGRMTGCEIDGFVEGDDGIFSIERNGEDVTLPDAKFFEQFGMELKIERLDNAHTASFCGNVYHPESLRNVTNPISKILKMGWTLDSTYFDAQEKVMLGLQRAAALSLACGYPGCPILASYARWLLRRTEGVDPRFGDKRNHYTWDEIFEMGGENWRTRTQDAVLARVRPCDRLLVAGCYGISIEDQLTLEQFFDSDPPDRWTNDTFLRLVSPDCRAEVRNLCCRHPDPLDH